MVLEEQVKTLYQNQHLRQLNICSDSLNDSKRMERKVLSDKMSSRLQRLNINPCNIDKVLNSLVIPSSLDHPNSAVARAFYCLERDGSAGCKGVGTHMFNHTFTLARCEGVIGKELSNHTFTSQ